MAGDRNYQKKYSAAPQWRLLSLYFVPFSWYVLSTMEIPKSAFLPQGRKLELQHSSEWEEGVVVKEPSAPGLCIANDKRPE